MKVNLKTQNALYKISLVFCTVSSLGYSFLRLFLTQIWCHAHFTGITALILKFCLLFIFFLVLSNTA